MHSFICRSIVALSLITACACCTWAAEAPASFSPHPDLALKPVPRGLGVNIHFFQGNEHDLAMLEQAGVGTIRMDVGWGGIEKEPGKYDFSRHDRLVADMEKRGIRILFIIDYGNALYDGGLSPHSEECRQAYAKFCGALAGRYADKDVIWELWNEPNISFWKPKPNVGDYVAWCKAVVPAIRAADPTACILAPATSGFHPDFHKNCYEQGLLELVDGISVHPYRSHTQGPETAVPEYRNLRALIDQYLPKGCTRHIPILSGEWGYSVTDSDAEKQGKYLPRQWLVNMAEGVPISIWYDWHDDGTNAEEREHNFGTVTWDYKPKPAYRAMCTFIAELKGYTCVGWLDTGDRKDHLVAFRKGDIYKLAAWTTGDAHPMALDPAFKVTRVVRHTGETEEVPAENTLGVDDTPRYLTVNDDVPTWLQCLPVRPEARAVPAAEDARAVEIRVPLRNLADKAVQFTFAPIEVKNITGAWVTGESVMVKPGLTATACWRGTFSRKDLTPVEADVAIKLDGAGIKPHEYRYSVLLPLLDDVSMKPVWRQDGLSVEVSKRAGEKLEGNLVIVMDGKKQAPVPVSLDTGKSEQTLVVEALRLSATPVSIACQLLDSQGNLIAERETMSYRLAEPVDLPLTEDAASRYRLWHEGDKDRKAKLKASVVASPGPDAPYERSIRVDYETEPGWCFWQVGPKSSAEMGPAVPKYVQLWVYGDGSKDAIRARVVDATGQTFQIDGGAMDFTGWRLIEMPLDKARRGHWGGANDGEIHPPLRWVSYCLYDPMSKGVKGTTYITGVVVAW